MPALRKNLDLTDNKLLTKSAVQLGSHDRFAYRPHGFSCSLKVTEGLYTGMSNEFLPFRIHATIPPSTSHATPTSWAFEFALNSA